MLSLLLMSALAASNGGVSLALSPSTPELGGVLAPAALGPGTMAVYGLAGAPELAAGYRQGFESLEFEARVSFDVLQAAGTLEAGVKVPVFRSGRLQLSVGGLLGLKLDSGASYADPFNFAALSLQPRALAALSLDASEGLALLARVEVPLAVALTAPGWELKALLSAGGELRLGPGLSMLVLGQVGVDAVRNPTGASTQRVAWGLQFGVGYRIF
jgi:hypothetical protein